MTAQQFTTLKNKYLANGVKSIIVGTNLVSLEPLHKDKSRNAYRPSMQELEKLVNDSMVSFYKFEIAELTKDFFEIFFSENSKGEYDFRINKTGSKIKRKNNHFFYSDDFNNKYKIAEISYHDIKAKNDINFGYKSEIALLGKAEKTHNLIDGYYNGEAVQLKVSIGHANYDKKKQTANVIYSSANSF